MRQASTAARVYHRDIVPSLEPRQAFVRVELAAYVETYGDYPTGQELLASIRRRHPGIAIDVNGVRPRCFELREAHWIKEMTPRVCSVTGKTVKTWALDTPPAEQPKPEQRPSAPVQGEMFS